MLALVWWNNYPTEIKDVSGQLKENSNSFRVSDHTQFLCKHLSYFSVR